MNKPFDKIKLHGFNNLTKSLSFSIYDICYAKTEQQRKEYIEYIDEQYSVHTYPEAHPDDGICTFRADIEVSTCGIISPLKALNFLIHSLESDVVTIDYRVRGFTRDVDGVKHYIDHAINSIQNYMTEDTKEAYQMMDVNVYQENLFHTKMMLKETDLNNLPDTE